MSSLNEDVLLAKKIYDDFLSSINAKLFISQQIDGSIETVVFKDIDSFIKEKDLQIQSFKNIEEYTREFSSSSSSLSSLERFFNVNKGKELHCINSSFSFDKEALAINQGHKGLDLLVIDLNKKDEVNNILSISQEDKNYSKKELLVSGILEANKSIENYAKEVYLNDIVKQYENSNNELKDNEFYIANYGTDENVEIFKSFDEALEESINNEVHKCFLDKNSVYQEKDGSWNYNDNYALFVTKPVVVLKEDLQNNISSSTEHSKVRRDR